MTGREQRVQWTQTIARVDLPAILAGSFQPLFKLSSGVGAGGLVQGWEIESIAINASQ